MASYKLTRSKRKSLAIYIRDGLVEVRAPLRAPASEIHKFVLSKEKWIRGRLEISAEQKSRRENFSLNYGDSILYRGQRCLIRAKNLNNADFDGSAFCLPPGLGPEQIKIACARIYTALAKRELIERALSRAEGMPAAPAAIRISGAKKRWGSCSTKKNINFSWRLIMADDEVIDYVIVHELAHLTEMNHSARFWAIVEKELPDYRKRQARLKELQYLLGGENW